MRIGLVGVGRMGGFHAATLSQHPDVGQLVVADVDGERTRAVADGLGVEAAGSVSDIFSMRLDAVCIAASTSVHAELVCQAARSGLPVFCEKPVALDVAAARAVLAEVAAAGVPFQVGFQRRFDRRLQRGRDAVAHGGLGKLSLVRMVSADPAPPPAEYLPGSGGLFRDLHVHDFDILRWVTGREVASVFAVGSNRGAGLFSTVGDVSASAVLLTLDDETLVTLTGSRYNGAGYDVRMELAGWRSTLTIGLDDRVPLASAEPGATLERERPYEGFLDRFADAYRAELAAFLDYARGRIPCPCSGEDAVEALCAAEACDRSRREDRRVLVEEVRATDGMRRPGHP